jgi:hypothetical protein
MHGVNLQFLQVPLHLTRLERGISNLTFDRNDEVLAVEPCVGTAFPVSSSVCFRGRDIASWFALRDEAEKHPLRRATYSFLANSLPLQFNSNFRGRLYPLYPQPFQKLDRDSGITML